MKTGKSILLILVLILVLSLAACGSNDNEAADAEVEPTQATVVDEVVVDEPEVVDEPIVVDEPEVEEVAEVTPEMLTAAFTHFLGGMTAYNTIGLEDTNALLAEDPPPFLLDVRELGEVEEKGHIESAVVIPLRELGHNMAILPSFDTPIIAYCGSGWRATIAMTALEGLGYEDVKVLKGGSFGGWVEAGYPVIEGMPPDAFVLDVAAPEPSLLTRIDSALSAIPEGWGGATVDVLNTELIEAPDVILIDVRRPAELAEKGTIAADNVIPIPLEEFVADTSLWPADLNTEIVAYCGSGHRSTIAMSILWSYGYTNVRSLKGGFNAWADAGFAVAGGQAALDSAFMSFLDGMEGYNTIGLEDTNALLAQDPPPFLLDVREASELEAKGHIESAIHIPLRELGDHLDQLPSFDTPIITYCGSGWRATIAMTALEALGWENVKVLKGGSFGGWVDAGYPIIEGLPPDAIVLDVAQPDASVSAKMRTMLSSIPEGWGVVTAEALNTELTENPDLILIDVRRAGEVADKGVIAADNLLTIPIEAFVAHADTWPADKDAPIVIYCGSGHRSTIAMSILWSYGYTNVLSLKGGFSAWADAGYAIASGQAALDGAFESFLDRMEGYNTIGLEDTNALLAQDPPPFLLDVREASELEAKGHIESAIHIPLRELGDHLDQLPSFDTPIITYCGSGWRATIAMTALEALGWENVKVLKGGSFGGWVDADYPIIEGLPPDAFVLDIAQPDAAVGDTMSAMFSSIPEGWGVVTAEALNTELIENADIILIDVRRAEEIADKGVILADNLLTIPIEAFMEQADMWPADKDAPIVIYCGSGHRSTIAMSILWAYGYTNVLSLKGGFGGWVTAGFPVAEFVAP